MRVVVTGANGFVGKNLLAQLRPRRNVTAHTITRVTSWPDARTSIAQADFVFHLAGVNRPSDTNEFTSGNVDLTARLCDEVRASGRRIPIVFSSSTQAENDNPYGRSKRAAEGILRRLAEETASPVYIYRLPNVFGKWCRPNYNSVVATFCYNSLRDIPLSIHNRDAPLRLAYVDDVVAEFLRAMDGKVDAARPLINQEYNATVGELADQIVAFKRCRTSLVSERVGVGLVRALYATYMSYMLPEQFSYPVTQHSDPRGSFVEVLKTQDSGQFSFFTARPGVTRGGHYHHTKTEKFVVLNGRARFRFRHILTDETYEISTDGAVPTVVETIPGWAHDITNVGTEDMVVMLWANEIFDRDLPDTYTHEV